MATGGEARAAKSPTAGLSVLAILLVLLALIHVGIGSYVWRTPWDVLAEILRGRTGGSFNDIVWQIRLPRALGCLLIGGILGAVGSAFQALFRNPLAEPYVVGVSSGAAAGGTAAVLLGVDLALGGLGMLGMAFIGGVAALVLVLAVAGRRGVTDMKTLLLAGVVVSTLLSALLAFMLSVAGKDTTVILRWLLGSTDNLLWPHIGALVVACLIGSTVLALQTKKLNAFAVDEAAARHLGIDTERLTLVVLGTGAAMTAVAVGSAGIIGFLGLVAPHASRRMLGVDWRWSLLGSALLGGSLLLASDVLAQRVLPGRELQVGIVTALLGAPFLLILLRKD